MGCENGEHLWKAAYFKRGATAFWFCESCGETDRDVEKLEEPLDRKIPDNVNYAIYKGSDPPHFDKKWLLKDGSVLKRLEPSSVFLNGKPLPELPEAYEFVLELAETGELREYRARLDRSSNYENSFMITRYLVDDDRLLKYRTHGKTDIDTGETFIDPPSIIAILTGLSPMN